MNHTFLSTLLLAGMSCGMPCLAQWEEYPPAPPALPSSPANEFAIQIFHTLAETQPGNFIFSPMGLNAVLGILQQGARGTTAMALSELPLGQPASLSAMCPTEANALFIADTLTLKSGTDVDAVYRVPFETDTAAAVKDINNWSAAQTLGLIPAIVTQNDINSLTRMVATCAIYLNEKWLYPFKKNQTQENILFTMSDGSLTTVNMMYSRNEYRYAEGEDWQAVALPYDTMGRTGEPGYFIGILPLGNVRDFARTLTPDKYQRILTALTIYGEQETIVRLPRFEMNPGTISLAPALQACGLGNIFTPQADFSGFTNEAIYMSNILQRCYVKTDEEGTEAAAVTAAIGICWAAAPSPVRPREINFNRPFIWIIGDLNSTAPPYFMGLFEQP